MVYADWLLEHGDLRGELISLQSRLHTDPPLERRLAFVVDARCTRLLDEHRDQWFGHLRHASDYRVRRGFADEVWFESDKFAAAAAGIAKNEPALRALNLERCIDIADALGAIAADERFRSLRVLRLSGWYYVPYDGANLVTLLQQPWLQLVELQLPHLDYYEGRCVADAIVANPALKNLQTIDWGHLNRR